MTEIENDMLKNKQLTCDLIEIGVTRAAGVLIRENIETVDDDALTLYKVRALSQKLNTILEAFDRAQDELNNFKSYIVKRDAADKEQAIVDGVYYDNHE